MKKNVIINRFIIRGRRKHGSLVFICDLNNGIPLGFYSLRGAALSKFTYGADGNINWYASQVIIASYEVFVGIPEEQDMPHFEIYDCDSRIYKYVFNNFNLIDYEKTNYSVSHKVVYKT